MHDHDAAIQALLYLPIALLGGAILLNAAASRGSARARAAIAAAASQPRTVQIAALLATVSAAIHLALAPEHAAEGGTVTAILFGADAAALVGTGAAAVFAAGPAAGGARVALAVLCAAGIAAYALYIAAGWEAMDPTGIATKAVEATAAVLILASRRRRPATNQLEVSCR